MNLKKKAALGLGTSALVAGGVVGLSSTAVAETPTPTPSATSTPSAREGQQADDGGDRRGGRHGHGQRDGELASSLAEKLGLKEADVTAALKKARDASRPEKPSSTASPSAGTQTDRPDPAARQAALAKSLAPELKVDEAKVAAALQELRTARDAGHKAELRTRLDDAVKAGKLTAEEADAVVKAADAGVIGYGGGRR